MAQPVAVVQPNGIIVPPVAQPPARPPCVLPNDPNFTTSMNGRNGWNFENFYDISAEVRPKYVYICTYIVNFPIKRSLRPRLTTFLSFRSAAGSRCVWIRL